MSAEPIVHTAGLSHRYGERLALDRVDFNVPTGSIYALLGPNGGGKTTLFKILATLIRPTAGVVLVGGHDVVAQRALVRHKLGIVFQHPSLDRQLTVMENLTHQGYLYGLSGRRLAGRCSELLARFDLTDRAADRTEMLSGGLRRRVEIAKSLLHRPRLLVLDEPSTGLDPAARSGLVSLLQELRGRDGVTSLLTTHLMEDAEACDQVAILDRGRLVTTGTPSELKSAIGGDVVTVHARNAVRLAEEAGRRFSVPARVVNGSVHIERDRGHEFVPALVEAFPGEIKSVTVGGPTLGDVFLHLTGHHLGDEQRGIGRDDG